jgi:hypothetical protein
MVKEKEFIQSNQKIVAKAGTVMTPAIAKKLLHADRTTYSHLLVVMDTFSYEIYSVLVEKGKLLETTMQYNENMQRVKEAVLLEETNQTIKNYFKHNTPDAFYYLDGMEA